MHGAHANPQAGGHQAQPTMAIFPAKPAGQLGGEPGAAEVGWLGVQRGRGTHEGYSRAGCGTAVCISSADVCRATW